MRSRVIHVLSLSVLIALLFPRDAFAYLDPGSGSLIFQTIVATLAGAAYAVRLYWHRIRSWFSREPQASQPAVTDVDRHGPRNG